MRSSGKTYAAIAEEMTAELGREVTASALREFTRNPSVRGNRKRQARFPAAWLKALRRAVGDDTLLRGQMTDGELAKYELGEWGVKHLGADRRAQKRSSRRKRV